MFPVDSELTHISHLMLPIPHLMLSIPLQSDQYLNLTKTLQATYNLKYYLHLHNLDNQSERLSLTLQIFKQQDSLWL